MSSVSVHPPGGRHRRGRRLNDRPALPEPEPIFCIICDAQPDQGNSKLYKLSCNHYHCARCLNFNFNMCVRGRPFAPARCCPKTPIIDPELLREAVDAPDIEKHMDAYLAHLDEHSCKVKLYCHAKTCSAFIPADKRSNRVGTCPKCGLRTCKKCKAKSHWGPCSAERLKDLKGDEQLLALAGKKNWRQCPDCSMMVERLAGCSHMTWVERCFA